MKQTTEIEIARLLKDASKPQLEVVCAALLEAVIPMLAKEAEAVAWLKKTLGMKG